MSDFRGKRAELNVFDDYMGDNTMAYLRTGDVLPTSLSDQLYEYECRGESKVNYEEMLLNLAKKVSAIKIPNIMSADDITLRESRTQKDEVLREIHRIRKLMKSEDDEI